MTPKTECQRALEQAHSVHKICGDEERIENDLARGLIAADALIDRLTAENKRQAEEIRGSENLRSHHLADLDDRDAKIRRLQEAHQEIIGYLDRQNGIIVDGRMIRAMSSAALAPTPATATTEEK